MGKANRARRAAKQRRRGDERRRGDTRAEPAWSPTADDVLAAAVDAVARVPGSPAAGAYVDALTGAPTPARQANVAGAVAAMAARVAACLWDGGWQPADVARVVDRELGGVGTSFVRWAITDGSRGYADLGRRVAPWWMDQVDDLGVAEPVGAQPWPLRWIASSGITWSEAVTAAVDTLALLTRLPVVAMLGPPPRAWRDAPASAPVRSRQRVDAKVLGRVRALLAKAESTDFEDEAMAFTAKAQELMTRHQIDRMLVDEAEAEAGVAQPAAGARRVGIDDPYAGPKALLLDAVADANRCRAVWSRSFGFCTVFGDDLDLDTVVLLFTSLLVQSTTAMRAAGAGAGGGARARSRSFRQSFLVGYASRIRQRLADSAAAATGAAERASGRSLVPVLADRRAAADDAATAALGAFTTTSLSASDGAGWAAGQAAADLADLGAGRRTLDRSA